MRALAIVHERVAGAGVFGEAIAARGIELQKWLPAEAPDPPAIDGCMAVLAFGGAMHPDQGDRHPWMQAERDLLAKAATAGIPVLGACLGAQILCAALGGEPYRLERPEIGWHEIELTPAAASDPVFGGLPERFCGFQWHSYGCTLPPEAVELARSPACVQGFRAGCAWAIQFHAEVTAADAQAWTADYRSDPDAVAIGLDPQALAAEIDQRIGAWNELGRALCGRFVEWALARA
jgi:GMP synthase-like glutamine amidotransferase